MEENKKEYKGFTRFLKLLHWSSIIISIITFFELSSKSVSNDIGYYPLYITAHRYMSYMSYILPLSLTSIILRNYRKKI